MRFSVVSVELMKDLGIAMATDYKWAGQWEAAAGKASGDLFKPCCAAPWKQPKAFIPLYATKDRPILEYC